MEGIFLLHETASNKQLELALELLKSGCQEAFEVHAEVQSKCNATQAARLTFFSFAFLQGLHWRIGRPDRSHSHARGSHPKMLSLKESG